MDAKYIEPILMPIPAGTASLGVPACPENSTVLHRWKGPRQVEVKAFQLAKFAVTQREFDFFLQASGYEFPRQLDKLSEETAELPVFGVAAADADAYCDWLRTMSGKDYRLPRCDEWEWAARGGLQGKIFPWGDDEPKGRCRFGLDESDGPVPVGYYEPNGYGLYDMVGNIWEWMADLYVDLQNDNPMNTPTGLPPELNRVLVGGSFMTKRVHNLWVAYRHDDPPDLRHASMGFRLALD